MHVRASKTILAAPTDGGVLIYNFLEKSAAICTLDALSWTSRLQQWTLMDDVCMNTSEEACAAFEHELRSLVELSIVLVEGSPQALREAEYLKSWAWGLAAGALHFSTLNMQFMSLEDSTLCQRNRVESGELSPAQFLKNDDTAIPLNTKRSHQTESLLSLMARRRTNREAKSPTITLEQLSDCLYAGMAITGAVRTPNGLLPLAMTPSGGARNPYEAYIFAKDVEGLAPGFYHYAALDNSLQLVNETISNLPSDMLAGQTWAEPMPVIIFLVGFLERSMWKYQDANAYRVVLIEAGHIGQNIMLAATAHGLSACPTAALHHETISRNLMLNELNHVPIYALTLSEPTDFDCDILAPAVFDLSKEPTGIAPHHYA
jgi:SagB-type dehydrogenase family enzyme